MNSLFIGISWREGNMQKKDSCLIAVLLVVLFVIGCIDFAGLYFIRSNNTGARLLPVSEIGRSGSTYLDDVANSSFYSLLSKNGFSTEEKSISQVIRLQQFIGNSVSNAGAYYGNERSIDLFKKGASGSSFRCGNMATLMNDALSALGYRSRLVQLYRSDLANTDTHMVVEVLIEKEWLLFDPTFNLTYERKGSVLGVKEVQELLKTEGPSAVNEKYHGDRNYPARIDSYYMDWRPLFSNAYVVGAGGKAWLGLPPFRWWYGPKYYYYGKDLLLWAKTANQIYFLFVVVLPIVLDIVLIAIMVLLVRKWSIARRPAKRSTPSTIQDPA